MLNHHHQHHHQPINVPTAGAQAFFMDYPQREWAIPHDAVRIGNDCKYSRDPLTYLLRHGGARVNKFLVTHRMTDQYCLASAIVRQAH
jgi:hypothetical protein